MPPPAWTRGLMGREPLSFELSIGPWVRVAYTLRPRKAAVRSVGRTLRRCPHPCSAW